MAKQQAKSPAQKYAESIQQAAEKLAITYTTSDGTKFHSEALKITKVKSGETQEKMTEKRRRDSEAHNQALEHERWNGNPPKSVIKNFKQ